METTVAALAEGLAVGLPRLFEDDRRLARTLARMLGEGTPVEPERLAAALRRPHADVARALAQLPGVYRDDRERVVGFWGLAVVEMPHRLCVDGRQLYGWCAWDTLFLPLVLGRPANVEATCPTTGEPLTFTVSRGGVTDLSPSGIVMTFLLPGTEGFSGDVIRTFCHFVHFFASKEAARIWTAGHERTFVISIDAGFELAQFWAERAFGVKGG